MVHIIYEAKQIQNFSRHGSNHVSKYMVERTVAVDKALEQGVLWGGRRL